MFELAVGNVLSERFRSICNTQKESEYIYFFAKANVQNVAVDLLRECLVCVHCVFYDFL